MRTTQDTLVIKVNGITVRVRPTAWGNWYGYIGSKEVQLFMGDYNEQQENAHKWAETIVQASILKAI